MARKRTIVGGSNPSPPVSPSKNVEGQASSQPHTLLVLKKKRQQHAEEEQQNKTLLVKRIIFGCVVVGVLGVLWLLYGGEMGLAVPSLLTSSPRSSSSNDNEKAHLDILKYHADVDESQRHKSNILPRATLAYVTPWNSHGYDVAKQFNGKFTHISPVWFQMTLVSSSDVVAFGGEHDVDENWVKDVKEPSPDTGLQAKVVPRVLFEDADGNLFHAFINDRKTLAPVMGQALIDLCTKHGFDGITFEFWTRLAHINMAQFPLVVEILSVIGDMMKESNLELIIVAPPGKTFNRQSFRDLASHVSFFSINAYDYSTTSTAGPIAPYEWVKKIITDINPSKATAHKLLIGLNFYGNLYWREGMKPVVGTEVVEGFRADPNAFKTQWLEKAREHVFHFGGKNHRSSFIFYPTLASIQERLDLFEEYGCGVAIWEIGQGLDYFYNLL
eukprot:m.12005 g.12005  ORF g.12005 m.12005 type:complete len:443 (+) comp3934_c0_seq1:262-1590(+)